MLDQHVEHQLCSACTCFAGQPLYSVVRMIRCVRTCHASANCCKGAAGAAHATVSRLDQTETCWSMKTVLHFFATQKPAPERLLLALQVYNRSVTAVQRCAAAP